MSGLDTNTGAVDADLLARRNTRLLLGALSEMTGFTLLVGELVLDQVPHAIERIAAKRGNADTLLQAFELWRREAIDQGVVRIVDAAQVRTHRLEHPVHRWVERTWEALRGDPTDIEHVSVALAGRGDVVLTSNMTCVDSDMLATAAAEAEHDVPRVLKRDRCIEHFRQLLGTAHTLDMIEEAILPYTLGDPDMPKMMRRMAGTLKASFPGVRREIRRNLRTHERYVQIAKSLDAQPMTRRVIEATWGHEVSRPEPLGGTDPQHRAREASFHTCARLWTGHADTLLDEGVELAERARASDLRPWFLDGYGEWYERIASLATEHHTLAEVGERLPAVDPDRTQLLRQFAAASARLADVIGYHERETLAATLVADYLASRKAQHERRAALYRYETTRTPEQQRAAAAALESGQKHLRAQAAAIREDLKWIAPHLERNDVTVREIEALDTAARGTEVSSRERARGHERDRSF